MKQMTRRNFLAGFAATGALATVGALSACSPESKTPHEANASQEALDEAKAAIKLPQSQEFNVYLPEAGTVAFEKEPITSIAETSSYDVVICGAGIAGVSAAASCAENGLKTLLLEKGDTIAARGGDVACVGDSYHKAAGVNIEPEEIVGELLLSSGYRADASLIRKWAYRCGEATDWMLETVSPEAAKGVIKFADGNQDCGGVTWFATQIEFSNGMGPIVQGLLDHAIESGAEILFLTPAVQLVQDQNGSITGVIAKKEDGSYIQCNASKGVILATGSYEFNPDKMRECCRPRDLDTRMWMNPTTTDTGDGHLMGLAVGGVEDEYPHTVMTDPSGAGFGGYGPKIGMKPFLRVNDAGQRFVNEYIPWDCLANAINSQMGAHDFCIVDDDMVAAMHQMADVHDYPVPFEDDYEEMKAQCVSADTLEELAEKLSIPADALTATIDRYNSFCDSGVDEDFGKEAKYLTPVRTPPFYGFDEGTMSLVTVSGLRVDKSCGVLSGETHRPIPGLYAIGNVQGSMFENFYPHHINGVSHGRCLTFGYLLGRELSGKETA
ncbi:FAD-dependent oxidoreductase [Arabiibacter massiliensis]|uniref:FAD-dependent oxidoreductase n=1 Tax=Arabiibacter massiliensis TaxID=1870985 RepID=UPI0009BB9A34|nr:FAD-dependent oxidoreductase [Arabiibacter massiliensis]